MCWMIGVVGMIGVCMSLVMFVVVLCGWCVMLVVNGWVLCFGILIIRRYDE